MSSSRFAWVDRFVFVLIAVILAALICGSWAGCGGVPRINLPKVGQVVGLRDQGKPAEIQQDVSETSIPLPEGSVVSSLPDKSIQVTLKKDTLLTQRVESHSATTGSVDQVVAQHRIDVEKDTALAKHRILIGVGLILVGAVLGFVLPGPIRWPLAGSLLAGVGLVLVVMPSPPAWLVGALAGGVAITFVAFYILKHQKPD